MSATAESAVPDAHSFSRAAVAAIQLLGALAITFFGLLAVTFGTALGTNVVNNWTMALAISEPLARANTGDGVIAGSMLGADIGPNLSVVGSLATLIWLTEVRRGGLAVSSGTYLRIGVIVTVPTILAATGTLYLITQFT